MLIANEIEVHEIYSVKEFSPLANACIMSMIIVFAIVAFWQMVHGMQDCIYKHIRNKNAKKEGKQ